MTEYNTVAAYFSSRASAESAINALEAAGFSRSQIGVAASAGSSGATAAHATTATIPEHAGTAYHAGHEAGSAWEKIKGFFTGNAAEPYAGETSNETFNDNVVTPDTYGVDDVHGSLDDLSLPGERSRYFGQRLSSGSEGAVITVSGSGREGDAAKILEESGGDVGSNAAGYDDSSSLDKAAATDNIQLYGEVLRVHKDRVSRGEVRLRKEVHTTAQTVEVPVTREELVVERVPVSGQVPAQGATFEGGEIRIPLSEERANVSKEAVVREEVRVGKKEVTNVEAFNEQVRSEELKVDGHTSEVTEKTA